MKEKPLVTICMAAYNSAKHISNAIESVLTQTYTNWELICVDDGSTDNTAELANSFSQKDSRVRVIKKSNAGPAQARRVAHLSGAGEYFISLDADDRFGNDAIELLVDDALTTGADLIMADVLRLDSAGEWNSFSFNRGICPGQVMSGEEAFGLTFPWTAHGLFLAKREIILSSTGPENFFNNYNCDEFLTRVYCLKANSVIAGRGKYFYETNPTSITSDVTTRRLAYIQTNEKLLKLALDSNVSPEILQKVFGEVEAGLLNYCSFLGHHIGNGTLSVSQLWGHFLILKKSEAFFLSKRQNSSINFSPTYNCLHKNLTRNLKFIYRFFRGYAAQRSLSFKSKKVFGS